MGRRFKALREPPLQFMRIPKIQKGDLYIFTPDCAFEMNKKIDPLKSVILQPLRNADLPGSLWLQDD